LLQLLCYLVIYDVPLPANSIIYITEFTKLIEFDILNPEGIIKLHDEDFVLENFISGMKEKVVSQD